MQSEKNTFQLSVMGLTDRQRYTSTIVNINLEESFVVDCGLKSNYMYWWEEYFTKFQELYEKINSFSDNFNQSKPSEKIKVINPETTFIAKNNTNYIFTQPHDEINITLPKEFDENYCDEFIVNFIIDENSSSIIFDEFVLGEISEFDINSYYEITLKHIGDVWSASYKNLGSYSVPITLSGNFIQFNNTRKNSYMSVSSSNDCVITHCGKNLIKPSVTFYPESSSWYDSLGKGEMHTC